MGWPGQPSLRPAHLWYTTSWLAEPGWSANQFLVHNVMILQITVIMIIIIINHADHRNPPKSRNIQNNNVS